MLDGVARKLHLASDSPMNDELIARLTALGVTKTHLNACKLPESEEPMNLVQAEDDMFARVQYMTANTLQAWQLMRETAAQENVVLLLVSAFRSIDYQCELIKGKLTAGQDLDNILNVNAIPGFSEHHTGRALDISTPNCEPLSTDFETTDAFHWLLEHAGHFAFVMSFPKDNDSGIIYEPWHWALQNVTHGNVS